MLAYLFLKTCDELIKPKVQSTSAVKVLMPLLTHFLLELQRTDKSMLMSAGSQLFEDVKKYLSEVKSNPTYDVDLVIKNLKKNIVSRRSSLTQVIFNNFESHNGITLEDAEVVIKNDVMTDLAQAIPELSEPMYVYNLPFECTGEHVYCVENFNESYRDAAFATADKVASALMLGYEVKPAGSGLMTSPEAIEEVGLSDNPLLAIIHAMYMPDVNELTQQSFTTGLNSRLFNPQKPIRTLSHNAELQSYLLMFAYDYISGGCARSTVAFKQAVLSNATLDSFLDTGLKKRLSEVSSTSNFIELGDTAKKHLSTVNRRFSQKLEDKKTSDAGYVPLQLGKLISMAKIAVCSIKQIEKISDDVLTRINTDVDLLDQVFECCETIKLLKDQFSFSFRNLLKTSLFALDEQDFNNTALLLKTALCAEDVPYRIAKNILNIFSENYPPAFKKAFLRLTVSADMALAVMGHSAMSNDDICLLSDSEYFSNAVIDYLLEVERQHPGLIFAQGAINKNSGFGVLKHNSESFKGHFYEAHFTGLTALNLSTVRNQEVVKRFNSLFLKRLVNEVTLEGIDETLQQQKNSANDEDMSFLNEPSL